MRLLGFFIPLFSVLLSVHSFAGGACLNPARTRQILQSYDFESWNPALGDKGGWERLRQVDLCDSQDRYRQAVEVLFFLEDFPVVPALQDDFDHDVIGGSPIAFFQKRIHTIVFEPPNDFICSPSTVAFVVNNPDQPNAMHICPYSMQFSTLVTASMMMHESRHIEGHSHVICDSGLYAGTFSCDATYEEGGSYGVGVEFFAKAHRNPLLNGAHREEARAMAVSDLLVRFNQAPLGIEQGALLLSNEGSALFFDGEKAVPMIEGIPATTKVVLRDLPGFFDTLTGEVKGYSGRVPMSDMQGSFAQEFRDFPESKRTELLDVSYGQVVCFLFRDSLHCEQGGISIDWPMPQGFRPIQFMPLGAFGLTYIVGEGKDAYLLPREVSIKNWTIDKLEKNQIASVDPFKSMIIIQHGKHFGVTREGVLMGVQSGGEPWKPLPVFQNRRFQKILGPFFWSPRMPEL